MNVKLLTKQHLEFLSLKGGCTGTSESTLVKMPHCWKSQVAAHFILDYSLYLYLKYLHLFCRLGDKRFSSNESLEAISWGAVSEKDKRSSGIIEYIEIFLYFQCISLHEPCFERSIYFS